MPAILRGAEPTADAAELARNWERLLQRQGTFREMWQTIADYLCPHKSTITRTYEPGAKQTSRVFDGTGIRAPFLLAASIHGGMTPVTQKWLSLTVRQKELKRLPGAQAWLEEDADRLHLAKMQANWNTEIAEWYHDLVTFGTGAMLTEAKPGDPRGLNRFGGFRYKTLPIGSYAIDEGRDGRVDTLYRTFTLSRRTVLRTWGAAVAIDRGFREQAEQNPYEPTEILHAVYPRQERRRRSLGPRGMPFTSCYVLMRAGDAQGGTAASGERIVLAEGGYRQFPFAVARWSQTSGEVYGRGPGHNALPDIRTLNRMKELNLQYMSKVVDPPMLQKHEAVLGVTDLTPAGVTVVDYEGPVGEAVSAMEIGRNDRQVWITVDDLKESIREAFYWSLLQLQERKGMTATEVQIRYEFMQRLLGPTFGRLKDEGYAPILERDFALMAFYGALPPVPEELAVYGDAVDIDIEYEGPLARAQRSHDLVAIDRFNGWLGSVLPFYPQAQDIADFDEQGRVVAEVAGMPANILRDEKAVARIRQDRAQQQQQAALLETIAGGAEALGKAGPGVKALAEARQAGQEGTPA
jgi:hypothetical protein